ncbi:uncharacterized protein EV420DRAFT_1512030 [Desarmillaria tabescens]|uniref:Uncharacterized protein n=1 Tax=Armillaria tabescens TaxID=1929756 RepID=A0AA39NFZ2_ARMTA|nr:uncharacterized protein EV420DRAFT_1512030 [Desarmillaria tabescens]KAK0464932.1 hypothetical protein EV420DRAFT_1512030 [Desarmillaria tabescens]
MSFLQRSKTAPDTIHPGPVRVARSVSHEQILPSKKKQPLNETASSSRVWAQRRPQKKGGYMQGWGPSEEEWDWLKEREARQGVSEEEVEETIRKEDKMGILFLSQLFGWGDEEKIMSPYDDEFGAQDHESLYLALSARRAEASTAMTASTTGSRVGEQLFCVE